MSVTPSHFKMPLHNKKSTSSPSSEKPGKPKKKKKKSSTKRSASKQANLSPDSSSEGILVCCMFVYLFDLPVCL